MCVCVCVCACVCVACVCARAPLSLSVHGYTRFVCMCASSGGGGGGGAHYGMRGHERSRICGHIQSCTYPLSIRSVYYESFSPDIWTTPNDRISFLV